VNNPLETVTNLLYLLRMETLNQQQTAYLDEAMQQVQRISQVASQTLKFSRSSNRDTACKPSELIENTLQLLRPKLQIAQVRDYGRSREDKDTRRSFAGLGQSRQKGRTRRAEFPPWAACEIAKGGPAPIRTQAARVL
jgi:signal transduction histidine kinase